MIKYSLFVILLFLLAARADNTFIVKVQDSNLFVLNDGRKIRLADVRTPSVADSDRAMAALAKRIKRFGEVQLLKQKVEIEFTSFRDDSGYVLAHVYQIYPLERRNMNAVFLEKGFGWFVDNADSLHRAAYRKAEESAQKKQLGLWNPHYPAPPAGQRYQAALLLGGIKGGSDEYMDENNSYQEALLEISPVEKVSGVTGRLGIVRHVEKGSGCCECMIPPGTEPPRYNHVSLLVYAGAQLQMMNDFMGFAVGMTAIYNERNYCDGQSGYFVIPNLGLRIGWMKKIYLTADLFNEFILPYSVGVQYIFDRKASNLWLGLMQHNGNENIYAFSANYMINERWILKVQGIFHYPEWVPGLRIGIGYVVGHK